MSDKFLIVDDDPLILSCFERILRSRFLLDTASGGERALESIVQKGPYAVIMSDLHMPGMSGVDFLKKAKELCPKAVCLLLTGNAAGDDGQTTLYSDLVFRVIAKPCSMADLIPIIDEAMEKYRGSLGQPAR